jgi:hypothetical protein
MNRKKIKVLRRRAKEFLVLWLKSLLPEEEQKKVNINNILSLMPTQTHYIHNFQLYLSAWSKTKYSDWCEANNFIWCDKDIPLDWMR